MLRILIAVFISFFGCKDNLLYKQNIKIEQQVWNNQELLYRWSAKDTSIKYDLVLNVKYNDKIPSQNIYIHCTSTNPSGDSTNQNVSLELLDITGKPLGNCGFGSCTAHIVLASKVYFPTLGEYSLKILPFSRINPIPGLMDIGLTIEKSTD